MIIYTKPSWISICFLILTALTSYVSAENVADKEDLSRRMIIVSTIDGKLSALNENDGTALWSIDVGAGPLVSSSISKLQIVQDGKVIRLIPSLSGGLFKFDGNSVEALPFTADQLLSSSFKAADGTILVGDNEVNTFGIDSTNGRMLYFCTAAGCDSMERPHSNTAVIVMKRHQKTVRSVDNRNGIENWNFSVGELHLEISAGAGNHLMPVSSGSGQEERFHKIRKEFNSAMKYVNSEYEDAEYLDENEGSGNSPKIYRIQVSVPDGEISYISDGKKRWAHKFSSPVASAWHIDGTNYHKIDLFDPKYVPALRPERSTKVKNNPTIYLGFYHDHVYIQVSRILEKASGATVSVVSNELAGYKSQGHYPVKFAFRPYLASTNRLTEAVVTEAKEGELAVYGKSNSRGTCNDNWGVLVDRSKEKDSELGYYLKSDIQYYYGMLTSQPGRKGKVTEIGSEDEFFENFQIDVIYPHLLLWWKEVLLISVVTSVLVHLVLTKFIRTPVQTCPEKEDVVKPDEQPTEVTTSAEASNQYTSRFLHDFEPVRCLGKGGFGIVLESRNKVDDCSYAIKRIQLPNKESAREKVLREVRALAKLNHNCIVRYYNAWIEEPPAGWQEKIDQEIVNDIGAFSPSGGLSTTQPISKSTHIKAPEIEETQSFSLLGDDRKITSYNRDDIFESEPFTFGNVPTYDATIDFSEIPDVQNQFDREASFSDDTTSEAQSLPFGRYAGADNSLSIVFESSEVQPSTSKDSAIEEDAFDKHIHNSSKTSHKGNNLKNRLSPRKTSSKPSNVQSDMQSCTNATVKLENVYLYIQMELCQKESLRAWLAGNHQRNDKYCLKIFKQVLSAVDYIHGCNLIHRDLKPSNIFFSPDGYIKVGDFGLVTESDDLHNKEISSTDSPSPLNNYLNESHTEKVGTRLYMAPEQMTGRSYSQKVDIFALGLILIELFTRFSTQMERVHILTKSRDGVIAFKFQQEYRHETTLAKEMLSLEPRKRPSAKEALVHNIFSQNGKGDESS